MTRDWTSIVGFERLPTTGRVFGLRQPADRSLTFDNRMVIGTRLLCRRCRHQPGPDGPAFGGIISGFFDMKQQCFMSILFESLILAQDERWRRALCMQVERSRRKAGQWRTGEYKQGTYLLLGHSSSKDGVISHEASRSKCVTARRKSGLVTIS